MSAAVPRAVEGWGSCDTRGDVRGMLNACMAFLAALKSCGGSYAYSV